MEASRLIFARARSFAVSLSESLGDQVQDRIEANCMAGTLVRPASSSSLELRQSSFCCAQRTL